MSEDIKNKLKILIHEVYGINVGDSYDSLIINELGSISDDNDVFFDRFSKEFNVDMKDFNYYEFYSEDEFILLNILRGIKSIFGYKDIKKKLTMNHLVNVIKSGKWFDPPPDLA